jgi:hypothetical protein
MTRIFTLLLVCISICGISQSTVTPKFWTGGELEYRISKWVKLDLYYQYRTELHQNYNSYTFSDIEAASRITKQLALKQSFRISRFSEINNDENRARFDLIYKFGKKKSAWNFGVRARS